MNKLMTQRVLISGMACLIAGGLTSPAKALLLYSDNVMSNAAIAYGKTQVFAFGPFGGQGIWDHVDIMVERGGETNYMAGLVAVDATAGGQGFATSIQHDLVTGIPGHGLLQPGNVIRLSAWFALDPNAPLNRTDGNINFWKIEFYQSLGGARVWDSAQDTGDTIVGRFGPELTANDWTQISWNYVYSPAHFNAATVQEIRPVLVMGDFSAPLKVLDGNVVADNFRVEIFTNLAAAAATPLDPTYPGILPSSFEFIPFEILNVGRTNTTFIAFDAQPGVQYLLEYSESGPAGPWSSTGLEVSGDGTRMTLTDPDGPSTTRSYRIQVVDPDFEEPL